MPPCPRCVAASGMTNIADGVAVVSWAWLAPLLTRDALLVATFVLAAGVCVDGAAVRGGTDGGMPDEKI